jgi:LuxR family transcriptional regulator, maltose regulon positive regulatory protein
MTATLLDAPTGTDEPQRLFDPLGRGTPSHPRLRASVRRPRLIATLDAAGAPPFAVLVAPAGYGKTALLCQWSARDPRPFAWVTLDRRMEDPDVLRCVIAAAVDRAADRSSDGRLVLVVDDVHAVASPAARDVIASLALQPPDGMTIAFASRTEPPLPVARLRAQGLVTELRADELAMSRGEAAALLRGAGLHLEREDVDALLRRTEGWPAALALAVLSLGDRRVPGAALTRFGGGDRLIAEFLREEVLSSLPPEELRFVRRTAILDVLTGPLCDALLERSGSADLLARLQRANFPLVALDRTGERFRHHRLITDLMRAELLRSELDVVYALHRRASVWHAQAGDRERALEHALAGNEVERAGNLIWSDLPRSVEHGSSTAVEHWLSRFTSRQIAAHPQLALAASGVHLTLGQGHLAEHWLRAAESATPADGDAELRGGIAALHAALARDGLERMGDDANRASGLLPADSPCQTLCALVAGVAEQLRGNRTLARRHLEDGARHAAVPSPQIHALCLTQLALLALDDDRPQDAAQLAARARAQVERFGLERYPTSALILAVSALVRAQRGRVEEATQDMRDAAAHVERLTDLAPWYVIAVEIVIARAALRLSDVNAARDGLAEAGRLLAGLPEATVLLEWLHGAEADLAEFSRTASQLESSLTTAELRILLYLPTHLSFREIGERTFVSANTVKTQANGVYRKLGARSRSEAVTCARRLGLIDP